MKQSEKTKNTYRKILMSAIEEFSEKSYDNASLNAICEKYNISKGIIYYHFKNKDELYLCSVEECFNKFMKHLKVGDYSGNDPREDMKKLLLLRQDFFERFPRYQNIFFGAVLTPPAHLIERIKSIKKEYDALNIKIFKALLKKVKLRKGITEEMGISYFLAYQEMFNGYFQNKIYKTKDLSSIGKEHDVKLVSILDVMLYGIAFDENEEDNAVNGGENL